MNSAPRILLIEHDPNVLGFLKTLIGQAGYIVLTAPSGKEGLIEAWRHRPELIIIDGELPDLNGLEVARKLRGDQRTAKAKLLLISARSNPEDILAGIRTGADEYIVKRGGADAELLGRIRALFPLKDEKEAAAEKPGGKLVTFLSAKGGTGVSSLCANMGQVLTGVASPSSVAVVDLVLPIGSIGQIVGVETPVFTIVDVTKLETDEITPEKIKQYAPLVLEWGFHLLAGAANPEAAQELQVGQLEQIFKALLHAFDYVLVDFGRALSRISLPLIRQSARVVLILSADVATVTLTGTTLKYLDLQGVRRNHIYPILNRAVGLEGMTKTELEQELALNIPGIVPHLSGAFALANNLHEPISRKFPNDSATFALHDLTVGLLNQIEAEVAESEAV